MSEPTFDISVDGSTLVVVPTRNISSIAEAEVKDEWDEVLAKMQQSDVLHVIFDFHRISYFGSSMLEAMLQLWKQIRSKDGKLVVCNVSDTAKEILRLSKFDTIWPVCDTRDDATSELEK